MDPVTPGLELRPSGRALPESGLVGRGALLSALRARLDAHTGVLITLHGPPGVGKSALGRVLEAERPQLLLLDDAEVAMESAVEQARAALAQGRSVLATSRERLSLRDEEVVEVPPLAAGEGGPLFVQRALMVRPDASPDALAAVSEAIAQAMDGLPFAIELAASRARSLGPDALLDRVLSAPLGLAHPHRDTSPRHSSVEGALVDCWERLDESLREVLLGLAVFPDAEVRVADLAGALDLHTFDVADRVEALADRSWLRLVGAGEPHIIRLRLVARWLGAQLAASPAGDGLRARHDRWAARCAVELGALADEGDLQALDRLESLRGVLVAALGRADDGTDLLRGLGPLLVARGPYDSQLLDAGSDAVALYRGTILRIRGALPEACEVLETAVSRAVQRGDARAEGRAAAELGIVLHEQGALGEAATHHERALELARGVRDRRGAGRALGSLAILDQEQGRPDDAQIRYEEALAVLDDVGDPRSVAIFRINLAELHRENGRLKAARQVLEAALLGLERVGDDRLRAVALGNLGAVQQDLGDLDGAVARRREAVALLARLGERRLRGVFLGGLAAARLELGETGAALGALDEALSEVEAAGDRRHAGLFRSYLGVIEASRGRQDAARAAFDAARGALEAVGDPALLLALGVHRAHLFERDRAREVLSEVASSAARSDEVRLAVRLLERAIGWARREAGPRRVLRVAKDGESFVLDDGETVDVSRRKTLKQILARLASSRLSAPGVPLSVESVLEAGWPGEKVIQEAALNRVYVAVATLRKLGLRDVLASRDSGYYLDDDVQLEYDDQPG